MKKNMIYSMLYQILLIITPLITAPYTARIFGVEGIGVNSFTHSIVAYFTIFATLGTTSYGQQAIARVRDDPKQVAKCFWEIELVSIISTVASLLFWFILIMLSDDYAAYYMVLSFNIIAVAFDISWFYSGLEKFKFIFVNDKDDLLLYISLISLSGLLGNISMWTYLPKVLVKLDHEKLSLKNHFKETLIYFVPTIAISIYTVADKTMIGLITKDEAENGYYEQANKIIAMAKTVLFSIITVMSSRMSYLFNKDNKSEFEKTYKWSINLIMFLSIPLCFGIASIAKPFVSLFFGAGYEKVILLLSSSSILLVIIAISNCLERLYFTPAGRKKESNLFVIIGAIVNACLNFMLIPSLKSYGATIATIIAELLITILYVFFSRNQLFFYDILKISSKYLCAGFVMFVLVKIMVNAFSASWIMLIIEIVAGALVYFLCLVLLKDKMIIDLLNKIMMKLKVVLKK